MEDVCSAHVPAANRPGLSALLRMAKSEDIDCVAITGYERLARDPAEVFSIVNQFQKLGVEIVSLHSDPAMDLLEILLVRVQSLMRQKTSERKRRAWQKKCLQLPKSKMHLPARPLI
jgi:DNA invertase Pin-like site-specific DNA recombinase